MYEAAAAADCFEVCVTSELPGRGHVFVTFCVVQKVTQKACSDVQKVAGGKFLCVGDRRNRENCERT